MARVQPTLRTAALAEFHMLSSHGGPAASCRLCAEQDARQRSTSAALRTHQRQTRQRVDAILDDDPDAAYELARDLRDLYGDPTEPWSS